MDRLKSGDGEAKDETKDDASQDPEERREQRSKHNRPPIGADQGGATDEEREE